MTSKGDHVPEKEHLERTGQWLPADHRAHQEWLGGVVSHVSKNPKELLPVMQEFQTMIEDDTRLYMLFSSMLDEVPKKKPYNVDPTGKHHQMRDYKHMVQVLNHLLTSAPKWVDSGETLGLVGLPINAVFDWPMGTQAGFALFLDPKVNAMLKKILNVWGEYLTSPASAACLGNDAEGWFGPHGLARLAEVANLGKTNHKFEEMFVCDPSAKHHGFTSWDHFFTRVFHEGQRPVASPGDDRVIANACESKPYKVAHGVKARAKFWVKGQPYSVVDMLNHDKHAEQFVGGTIYQAFLSALSYHRWHSPVSGTIVKAEVIDGTYYSEPQFEDFTETKAADSHTQSDSQVYITNVATRAIILIEADNKDIGLIAFVGVGMAEVSTCDITVKVGQHVEKGEQTGMFHFGGSTHCLLFRKGVKVEGLPQPGSVPLNVPVRGHLGTVWTT